MGSKGKTIRSYFARSLACLLGIGGTLLISSCQMKLHGHRDSSLGTQTVAQCVSSGLCVYLTSLTGGEVVAGGSVNGITWYTSGPALGTTPITIQASNDGGTTWTTIAGPIANTGSYAWTAPAGVENPNYRVRVTATDASGTSVSAGSTSSFSVDSLPPVLVSGQMRLNSGATSTANNFVQVSLSATDASNITHFCLRYNNTTTPAASDSCWVAVDSPTVGLAPSKTLTLANYPFRVGFISGTYTVYAWLKDQLGHITSLGGGTGVASQDKSAIDFNAGSPPVVINVTAYGTNAPGSPPTAADQTVANPGSVYIKWNATDDQALPANPVSLYYTTDDVNYGLIAASVLNSAGAGCTISGSETGCYVWNQAVTSGYLRIRVGVIDSNGFTTYVSAPPLNVANPFNFIAGNTDPGLNGHALQAIFFSDVASFSAVADPGSFAVAENGVLYFRDVRRGILKVDPADGIQKLLIPTTGTASGDGGSIASATLRMPLRIALDYQNRLLIFDYDRIRRIDLNASPMTISTIIGGGASSSDNIAPTSLQITTPYQAAWPARQRYALMPLFALPNGDIYFQSEDYYVGNTVSDPATGHLLRVYKASTGLVSKITLSGTGDAVAAGQDLSLCRVYSFGFAFDPLTSALTTSQAVIEHNATGCTGGSSGVARFSPASWTSSGPHPPSATSYELGAFRFMGKDGNLYVVARGSSWSKLARYNVAANTWTTLVGTGTVGSCPDGTAATACDADFYDAYVTAQGQLYFIDRGRIRTLDASGNVVTVMGQGYFFGDGGRALSARFNVVNNLALRNSGQIIVLDRNERRFREFTPGGTIQTIAGTGTENYPSTALPAVSQPVQVDVAGRYWDLFSINPANGDVFFHRGYGSAISKLDRSTGQWTDLVGNGATYYTSADGLAGSSVDLSNTYPGMALGYNGTQLLFAKYRYDSMTGIIGDSFLKLYDLGASATQTTLIGKTGASTVTCADGTAWNNCSPTWATYFTRAAYDSFGSRWLLHETNNANAIRTVSVAGGSGTGNIGTLATLATDASSFAYRRDAGLTVHQIFYCSTTDGKVHKKDLIANTDAALSWPVPGSLTCAGNSLLYDSANNKLIFPYVQNGLYGIVEYLNP